MEKYVFKPYDPAFPGLYRAEEQRLREFLGDGYPIQHVGSTAIPDLGGKGIIDILVLAQRDEMTHVSQVVQQQAGYDFRAAGSDAERLFHQQDLPDLLEEVRRYHLHITFPNSEQHRRFTAFIMYLKSHPDDLQQYADVKRLAVLLANGSRDIYNATKQPIIDGIIQRAYAEFGLDLNR